MRGTAEDKKEAGEKQRESIPRQKDKCKGPETGKELECGERVGKHGLLKAGQDPNHARPWRPRVCSHIESSDAVQVFQQKCSDLVTLPDLCSESSGAVWSQ